MPISIGMRDTRKNMADVIGNVFYGSQRYILERKGRPVAAIISLEDYKFLEMVEDMIDSKLLREAIESSEGTFPIEELFAERQRGKLSTATPATVISEGKDDV